MKNFSLILLASSLLLGSASCSQRPFEPVETPNPWPDNYSAVSGMKSCGQWGTYNVHDPGVFRVGDTYYMYSTDAIFRQNRPAPGYIQMRRSKDLVNWEFLGWAFDSIPREAVDWVRSQNDGRGAHNIWAPYPVDCGNGKYHLYYCVSAFGRKTSYLGVAEANSPEGPWTPAGAVVTTDNASPMNAIDPSVINANGRRYMHYGSFFGGLYCVELDTITGQPIEAGDQGKLIARRANWRKDNLEAPEIIYNPDTRMYYLFGSYDPLMTTYNVRVGRSENPDGPFVDFHGKELADTTDNYPILTAPYRFEGHCGWIGTAHCGVFADENGNWYMAHQGRLAEDPGMMVLHVRSVKFNSEGWPVVSPERYAGVEQRNFSANDLVGEWEIIRIHEPRAERNLEAGQILWGEGDLRPGEWCESEKITLAAGGKTDTDGESWTFDSDKQSLLLTLNGENIKDLLIFAGHDWERGTNTILLSGLDADGRAVWGKRNL